MRRDYSKENKKRRKKKMSRRRRRRKIAWRVKGKDKLVERIKKNDPQRIIRFEHNSCRSSEDTK